MYCIVLCCIVLFCIVLYWHWYWYLYLYPYRIVSYLYCIVCVCACVSVCVCVCVSALGWVCVCVCLHWVGCVCVWDACLIQICNFCTWSSNILKTDSPISSGGVPIVFQKYSVWTLAPCALPTSWVQHSFHLRCSWTLLTWCWTFLAESAEGMHLSEPTMSQCQRVHDMTRRSKGLPLETQNLHVGQRKACCQFHQFRSWQPPRLRTAEVHRFRGTKNICKGWIMVVHGSMFDE